VIESGQGEARIEARARIALSELRYSTSPGDLSEQHQEAERAIQVFRETDDQLGLARAWDLVASLHYGQGQNAAAQSAWTQSIEHARRAGSRRDELAGLSWLASVALWGPTHRLEARRRCEDILARVRGDLEEEAQVLGVLGCLSALEGLFDSARELIAQRAAIFAELGLQVALAWKIHLDGWVEMLAGDAHGAERLLRKGYDTLDQIGAKTQLQVVGSYLAQALTMAGQYEEAERLALSIEQLDPTGIAEIALARSARAKAVARLGRVEEGEHLAAEAVSLIDRTDFLIDRADIRTTRGEVLLLAGRLDEALPVLGEARRLHEEKGNIVSADWVSALLDDLTG
jgi:tetratricopeptide (TPR) repeat protein